MCSGLMEGHMGNISELYNAKRVEQGHDSSVQTTLSTTAAEKK